MRSAERRRRPRAGREGRQSRRASARAAAAAAGARDREVGDTARAERRTQERAHGGQLAGDRRLGELPRAPPGPVGPELGRVAREGACVELRQRQVVAAEPGSELLEVAPVRLPGRVGERRAAQEAIDGGACVHSRQFRLRPRLPAVLLRSRARNLVLASWETDADSVARALPGRLEPATVDGRHLVTIAALRWAGGRLGILPVPRFSQINVRLYARHGVETAVVFVGIRVTTLGMGGALLGMPVRPRARACAREPSRPAARASVSTPLRAPRAGRAQRARLPRARAVRGRWAPQLSASAAGRRPGSRPTRSRPCAPIRSSPSASRSRDRPSSATSQARRSRRSSPPPACPSRTAARCSRTHARARRAATRRARRSTRGPGTS